VSADVGLHVRVCMYASVGVCARVCACECVCVCVSVCVFVYLRG